MRGHAGDLRRHGDKGPRDMKMARRILLLICFALLAACNPYGWNQKLTVTVQTPDGPVSASSVTQVTKIVSDGPFPLPEARGGRSELAGEAVVVEVLPGEYLFVLLKGVDDLAFRAFEDVIPYRRGSEFARWARQIARHREPGIVPPANYPMMVMFEDISDPTSVRLVEPDDLESAFGKGFGLISMTLEIVDEGPTVGAVEELLPWLQHISNSQSNVKGLPSSGYISEQPDPEIYLVTTGDFSTEIFR